MGVAKFMPEMTRLSLDARYKWLQPEGMKIEA